MREEEQRSWERTRQRAKDFSFEGDGGGTTAQRGMSGGDIDLDSLLALSSLMRQWRDSHSTGLAHLQTIPALFDVATGIDSGGGGGMVSLVERAVTAAPSPRLCAFLAAGWQHPSVAAAAPQKLTDAVVGATAAAARAVGIAAEAERALDAFRASVAIGAPAAPSVGHVDTGARASSHNGGSGRHWVDDVPVPVLLTRVPWGANRTIEEWLWLCTAVVEGVSAEAAVKVGVAAYLSQQRVPRTDQSATVAGARGVGWAQGTEGEGTQDEEEERGVEALERGKLEGCAEVWGLQPYVDTNLLSALADGGD